MSEIPQRMVEAAARELIGESLWATASKDTRSQARREARRAMEAAGVPALVKTLTDVMLSAKPWANVYFRGEGPQYRFAAAICEQVHDTLNGKKDA